MVGERHKANCSDTHIEVTISANDRRDQGWGHGYVQALKANRRKARVLEGLAPVLARRPSVEEAYGGMLSYLSGLTAQSLGDSFAVDPVKVQILLGQVALAQRLGTRKDD